MPVAHFLVNFFLARYGGRTAQLLLHFPFVVNDFASRREDAFVYLGIVIQVPFRIIPFRFVILHDYRIFTHDEVSHTRHSSLTAFLSLSRSSLLLLTITFAALYPSFF